MAPPLPDQFAGRTRELGQLRTYLLEAASSPGVSDVAVYGPAQIGKTILATALCHDESVQDAYPDGILWVSLRDPDRFFSELSRLYATLTGETVTFADISQVQMKLAERLTNRRLLFVIDDVGGIQDLTRVPLFLAASTRLVLTPDASLAAAISRVLTLGPFTEEESVRFLKEGVPLADDETWNWSELARILQHSPMLLSIARNALRRAPEHPLPALAESEELRKHGIELATVTLLEVAGSEAESEALKSRLQRSWIRLEPPPRARTVLVPVAAPETYLPEIKRQVRAARQEGKRVLAVRMGSAGLDWSGIHETYDHEGDWERLITAIHDRSPVLRVPFMAPRLPEPFVERPAPGDELRDCLLEATSRRVLFRVGVWGPAGFGKTTLVAAVCNDERIMDAFPAGILWLSLREPATVEAGLRRVLEELKGESRLSTDEELSRELEDLLGSGGFLFVLDDVRNLEDVDRLPASWAPHARVVISRDRAVVASLPKTVSVGPMTREECTRLLARPDYATRLDALITRLHGWPLAVALARQELARGPDAEAAIARLDDRVRRHGVFAFSTSDRNIYRSFSDVLGNDQIRWLLELKSEAEEKLPKDALMRLEDLGLLE